MNVREIKEVLQRAKIAFDLTRARFVFLHQNVREFENDIEKVFGIILTNFPRYLHNALLYLIGELTDNISQHSNYSEAMIILNYDKKSKAGEVVVADNGISIPGAFEKKGISFRDDVDAIKMASKGKSTKKEEGRGFGLFSSINLVEKGLKGQFTIVSRRGVYSTDNSRLLPNAFKGTIVYIKFKDCGKGLNIYQYLE